jgi:hypothetical protein
LFFFCFDEIRQCFYEYFKKLAEPLIDSTFDMAYEQQVNFDSLLIEEITTGKSCEDIKTQITFDDVQKSIKSLNKGKAADVLGISAEHIQHGGQTVVQYIFTIFQAMFDLRIVPDEIKEDLLSSGELYCFPLYTISVSSALLSLRCFRIMLWKMLVSFFDAAIIRS